MVDYVIHADHPSDIREPQPSLRMKHKADLLECKYSYADKPHCEKRQLVEFRALAKRCWARI